MGEKLIQNIGFAAFALLLSWLLYWAPQSMGVFGGNDNFAHWFLARYAWSQPELFLRMWGRPVYTFFFSFAAYGGIEGLKVLNTLLFGLTALITADVARLMGYRYHSWLAVLTLSVPLMLEMSISGMTEIPMALVVVGALNLYLRGQYLAAALLISFSPFTRPEGWLFIAGFAGLYLLQKRWRALPWLLGGPVLFALVGWPVYGSPLWFLERSPYPMVSPYGSGSLWRFVKNLPRDLGALVFVGFVAGHVTLFLKISKAQRLDRLALILAPFWLFVGAHSYMWYKGIAGSMGLIRVLVSVFPLALLMSWSAWVQLFRLPKKVGVYTVALLSLVSVQQVWNGYRFPKPEDDFTKFSREVGSWYRSSEYTEKRLFCDNTMVLYFTEKNPFREDQVQRFFPKKYFPTVKGNDAGAFILWDSRMTRRRISLDRLMEAPDYRLVKAFFPNKHLHGKKDLVEVYAFERLSAPGDHDNYARLQDPEVLTIID